MVMQPRPMAETSRPLEPSLRCCINDSPSDGSSYRRHYLLGAQMCSPASHREGRLPGLLPSRHAPHHGTTDLGVLLRQRRPVGAHQSTVVASPFHAPKETTSDRRGP